MNFLPSMPRAEVGPVPGALLDEIYDASCIFMLHSAERPKRLYMNHQRLRELNAAVEGWPLPGPLSYGDEIEDMELCWQAFPGLSVG